MMRLAWRTLADGVIAQALARPSAPAVLAGRTVLSYGRLAELVQRCTVHLAAIGVQPGEVAAVALPTGVPALVLALGLLRLGAVLLAGEGPAAHLFLGPREAEVAGVRCHRVGPGWLASVDQRRGDLRLARPADAVHLLNPLRPPMLAEVSLRQALARVEAALALFPAIYDPARPARLVLPPGMPLAAALLFALPQFACGGPLLLPPGRLPEVLAQTEDPACPLSAAACRRLLAEGEGPMRFPRMRGLMVTAQGLEPDLARAIAARLAPVRVFLADPAAGFIAAGAPGAPLLPPPGLWVEVADLQGQILPPGQPGHLRLRGTAVSRVVQGATGRGLQGGWLVPGELAEAAADGFTLLDAPCDVVRRRGGEVFTLGIERALAAHPAVAAVAAVAAKGRAVAFVVPNGPPDSEALRRHIAGRVPDSAAPDQVHFLRALPRTAAGAVDRMRLAAMAEGDTKS
jgi:acyl-coenzyme A synthetase/AMP-(fatty) acid ligase